MVHVEVHIKNEGQTYLDTSVPEIILAAIFSDCFALAEDTEE